MRKMYASRTFFLGHQHLQADYVRTTTSRLDENEILLRVRMKNSIARRTPTAFYLDLDLE